MNSRWPKRESYTGEETGGLHAATPERVRALSDAVRAGLITNAPSAARVRVAAPVRDVPDFCVDAGRLDVLTACAVIERARLFVGSDSGLTHVAGALGTPTVAVHLGFPPETCGALGERVALVRQRHPFDDPAATTPEEVLAAVERLLQEE